MNNPLTILLLVRQASSRWRNPEDLTEATMFRTSFASDFINGQIIYVDGGILATIGKPANEL